VRVVLPALAVVVLVAGGLAAREPGSRQGRGPGTGAPAAPGKVTVDGCVQNAPSGSVSTSKYILSGARPSPRSGGAGRAGAGSEVAGGTETEAAAPATGTGAAAPAAAGAGARGRGPAAGPVRYRLDGDEKIITPHLNHIVEVTGTLSGEPAPPVRAGGAGPGASPITQTLKIESLKMVAAVCS
jgi:hypothetical protein